MRFTEIVEIDLNIWINQPYFDSQSNKVSLLDVVFDKIISVLDDSEMSYGF
jgi:hypothetical protein